MTENQSTGQPEGATPAYPARQAQPAVAWQPPPPEAGPAPGVEWAGYAERLVAYLLDALILGVAWILVFFVLAGGMFAGLDSQSPRGAFGAMFGAFGLLILLTFVVYILYFPFFWARGGQTPGMRPFGIRVVRDVDGGPVGWGAAFLRLLGLWISGIALYIGFIWVFIDKRRRGWHDLIASTVVIKDAPRR
jgi:uncharacterized RDD family membrane protein YckC